MASGVDSLLSKWEGQLNKWTSCKKIRSEESERVHQAKIALLLTHINELRKAYYEDETSYSN